MVFKKTNIVSLISTLKDLATRQWCTCALDLLIISQNHWFFNVSYQINVNCFLSPAIKAYLTSLFTRRCYDSMRLPLRKMIWNTSVEWLYEWCPRNAQSKPILGKINGFCIDVPRSTGQGWARYRWYTPLFKQIVLNVCYFYDFCSIMIFIMKKHDLI